MAQVFQHPASRSLQPKLKGSCLALATCCQGFPQCSNPFSLTESGDYSSALSIRQQCALLRRLTNTMGSSFCISDCRRRWRASARRRSSTQTRAANSPGMLIAAGVRLSMDGRGRWMDNVFIERLGRSLKHEDIYLKGYADGHEAHTAALRRGLRFTIPGAHIRRLATGRRWRCGAKAPAESSPTMLCSNPSLW
jgi:hypothetical protein